MVIPKINNTILHNSDILKELDTDYYEIGKITNNITIKHIKTNHLSHEKFGTDHYIFIINIDNKNILYLGDADYTKPELIKVLKNLAVDIIVAPFIIVAATPGRNFVRSINPAMLILNHLPNKSDDEYNYRNMVEKSIKKHMSNMPGTIIFQDLYDEVIIN